MDKTMNESGLKGRKRKGAVAVVGFGPGNLDDMTFRAAKAITSADLVIGYKTYIDILREYFPDAAFHSNAMTKEVERCEYALDEALSGKQIALVSSGDSGVYGMAGLLLEIVARRGLTEDQLTVEIIPGVTAASSAAALLGAPLMHDFAVISLSDLMTPLDTIWARVKAAAEADFVICIYNPKSRKRATYLAKSCEIIARSRPADTPCGIASHVGRSEETVITTTLADLPNQDVDMFSIVIIGNSQTKIENGKLLTPRGYEEKYLNLTHDKAGREQK
ncbi:MAG: precorrin-3B C(17)-methyltransferase [Fastidiosipilaceae bacterium]